MAETDAKRKPPRSDDIRRILEYQLLRASRRAKEATEVFKTAIPSAGAHPDGLQRILSAYQTVHACQKEMERAYTRLKDYLSRRIVPENLKRTG